MIMFCKYEDAQYVNVLFTIDAEAKTPDVLLEQLSFYRRRSNAKNLARIAELDVSDFFYGNDWRDHVSVLQDLLEDDTETLKALAFSQARISLTVKWVGCLGAPSPQVRPEDLGFLYFPGMHVTVESDWDHGHSRADMGLVSFGVYGPDPNRVTDYWGEPTTVVFKGDPIITRGEVRGYRQNNAWVMSIDDSCDSVDVVQVVKDVLVKLGPATPEWLGFVRETSADVQLRIVWYGASGQTVPILTHDVLKLIGTYGASVIMETSDFIPESM
ncbi:DUF4279 domain-containing protein [Magnetovibrio sp. PR-2]|uniref:DUF4279 domain-containing protein n=1 Tax=Magnetovibrio sp. PR-2 TaxID=3120356 RepID=UPI002FCDE815